MSNGELIAEIRATLNSNEDISLKAAVKLTLAAVEQLYTKAGTNADNIEKLTDQVKPIAEAQARLAASVSKALWAIGIPFTLAIVAFVWGLITHQIMLTLGP